MNAREAHDRAVQKLADEYERKGFRVQKEATLTFSAPDGGRLHADLLAERGEEHLVVEVKLTGVHGDIRARQWEQLAKEVRAHLGWHLKIVPVRGEPSPLPDSERIEAALVNAEALLDQGQADAALLLAASAFEASARLRLTAMNGSSSDEMPPVSVERLVSEGYVEQEEFVPLRDVMERRNAVAHGYLDQLPDEEAIRSLVAAARRLLVAH